MEEIKQAGLEVEAGEVMTIGADNPGVMWSDASEAFKMEFELADLILQRVWDVTRVSLNCRPMGKFFTSHFGISSSSHFRQILKSKNLEIVYYSCTFCFSKSTKSNINLSAKNVNLFLREP